MNLSERIEGIKIVDGVKYVNMARCSEYLGMSPAGWRARRDALVNEGLLTVYTFPSSKRSVYVKEEDLLRINTPTGMSSVEDLQRNKKEITV